MQKEDAQIYKAIRAALKLGNSQGKKYDRLDRAQVGHVDVGVFCISIIEVHPNVLILLTCIYFVNVHLDAQHVNTNWCFNQLVA